MALKAEEVYAILKKQIQSGGGTPGPAGVGIQKIEKTGTNGLVDTYTITYTNGQTTTYTVTNGADGPKGDKGDKGDTGEKGDPGTTNYNDLINKPTLNGVEISGDKTSADYKISAEVTRVDHGTSDITFQLPPNQYHTWGEVASLTITLGTGTSGQANGYWFSFDSGDTATTLSLPETIITDIVVEPNMHYECSIVGIYMTFEEWEAGV